MKEIFGNIPFRPLGEVLKNLEEYDEILVIPDLVAVGIFSSVERAHYHNCINKDLIFKPARRVGFKPLYLKKSIIEWLSSSLNEIKEDFSLSKLRNDIKKKHNLIAYHVLRQTQVSTEIDEIRKQLRALTGSDKE